MEENSSALARAKFGTVPAQSIPKLTPPPPPEFISQAATKSYRDAATALLSRQRAFDNAFQAPKQQVRRSFSIRRLKDSVKSSITKADVAAVFNNLIYQTPLPAVSLAQAVLNHAAGASIDDLWLHLGETASHSGEFR